MQSIDVRTIGSNPNSDLFIDDPSVESRHASLKERSNGSYVLSDMGTATGTYVNGESGAKFVLNISQNAIIAFGGVTLNWPADFHATRSTGPVHRSHSDYYPLEVRDLEVWYGSKPALVGVNLHLEPGTVTAIIGPSGVGKSTLFRTILGELPITSGGIYINGVKIEGGTPFNPGEVSFVPQNTKLIPRMTVLQTVRLAARARLARSLPEEKRAEEVTTVLNALQINRLANQPVDALSGGQYRRVSIALELVSDPLLLMLDEPSSGLDEGMDRDLLAHLHGVSRKEPQRPAVLVVTHSTTHLHMVDNIIAIGTSDGEGSPAKVHYVGPPADVLRHFRVDNFADVMMKLRGAPFTQERTWPKNQAPAHKQSFRTLSAKRSFAINSQREWLISPKGVIKSLVISVLFGFLIALLLSQINDLGISGSGFDPNPKFMVFAGMMVLLLAFWATYLPVMRIVEEWDVVRREQRWGISAKAHIWARIVRQLPEVLLGVLAVVSAVWFLTPEPTVDTPFLPSFWLLYALLSLSTLASYAIGILIGCLNTSPETALKWVVGTIASMIVLSGILFQLSEAAVLNAVSFVLPTRWGIGSVASSFEVENAIVMPAGAPALDWMFTMSDTWILGAAGVMVAMIAIILGLSMIAVERNLRQAKFKIKLPFIS